MSTITKHEVLVDRRFYFYKSILQNNKLFLPRNCYYVLINKLIIIMLQIRSISRSCLLQEFLFIPLALTLYIHKYVAHRRCKYTIWSKNLPSHEIIHDGIIKDLTFKSKLKFVEYIQYTAWKVSKYGVFFWSVFPCIWNEYGDLRSKSPYSVRIQENTDQKKLRIWTLFTQS